MGYWRLGTFPRFGFIFKDSADDCCSYNGLAGVVVRAKRFNVELQEDTDPVFQVNIHSVRLRLAVCARHFFACDIKQRHLSPLDVSRWTTGVFIFLI